MATDAAAGNADLVTVPRRWVAEAVSALDAASVIGTRSCRPGDGLALANHGRLIAEAASWVPLFQPRSLDG